MSRNARFFSSVNPSVDTDDVNSVLFGSAKKPKVDSSSSAGSSIAHQTDLFVNEVNIHLLSTFTARSRNAHGTNRITI